MGQAAGAAALVALCRGTLRLAAGGAGTG